MRLITVGSTHALVDDADFSLVAHYKWTLHSEGYAVHKYGPRNGRRSLYMHQLIMGGKMCDHCNRNRLDNQRSNLRFASHSQNHGNSEYHSVRKTSGYKGVGFMRCARKWRARAQRVVDGKIVESHLGLFESEDEAARAYDAAARIHFGDYALTNKDLGLLS